MSVHISMPLDSDGYLRRACSACSREFKWLPQDDAAAVPFGGYHCPYCGRQGDSDSWWTADQLAFVRANAVNFVNDQLNAAFRGIRRTNGPIRIDYKSATKQPTPALTEHDDMVVAGPSCHPGETVKVEGGWRGALHCLICGDPYPAPL